MEESITSNDNSQNEKINSKEMKELNGQDGILCSQQPSQNSNSIDHKFDLPSFKCDSCSYESIWKQAVKRHQLIHYRGQDIPGKNKKQQYYCKNCCYTTNNRITMTNHLKLHASINRIHIQSEDDPPGLIHNEDCHEQDLSKKNVYICRKCKFKTSCREIYDRHEKGHVLNRREEIFRCNVCSFNSLYKQSFLRHMKTKHDGYMNSCDKKNTMEELCHAHTNPALEDKTDLNGQIISGLHNNLTDQNSNLLQYHHITAGSAQQNPLVASSNSTLDADEIQKPASKIRRGKNSDVLLKTTKNGLYECFHCYYQTAIRSAMLKHQAKHLKNVAS